MFWENYPFSNTIKFLLLLLIPCKSRARSVSCNGICAWCFGLDLALASVDGIMHYQVQLWACFCNDKWRTCIPGPHRPCVWAAVLGHNLMCPPFITINHASDNLRTYCWFGNIGSIESCSNTHVLGLFFSHHNEEYLNLNR